MTHSEPKSELLLGDARKRLWELEDESVDCCITSPPYFGLRDYGVSGQLGVESTVTDYVDEVRHVCGLVHRVLKPAGTLWLNLGDSYANDGKWGGSTGGKHVRALHGNTSIGRLKQSTGIKAKNLIGVPWRTALALQADGWVLRSDIIWHKPNPMPESVLDRPTKSHEYIFLLSKNAEYYYDADAVKEPSVDPPGKGRGGSLGRFGHTEKLILANAHRGNKAAVSNGFRNRRDVWTVASQPYPGAHFAVFPERLIEPCVLAGCPLGGVVLDPFAGSGTVGVVCKKLGRSFIGVELNPEYLKLAEERIRAVEGVR